ncbi:alpha/beta hydrolase [Variovorax boronicumulans]|uniref:alpha/beta hydrolase n=1 Tax=Variovorax boronicumulans TaxID=436515 RepID=UPI001C593B44
MLDRELLPFVAAGKKAWPIPPEQLPVAEWRQRYESLTVAARKPRPVGLNVVDTTMGDPAQPVPVRIYRGEGTQPRPAMVFMHGGGWVIGSIESHDEIAADIAADTGCTVISVGYRLAPEHPFPAAFEDCLSVLHHVAAHAAELGIDAARILVGGDSAGANLAAALSLALRGTPQAPLGQVLLYPCLDVDFTTPSYLVNADAPVLTSTQIRWFLRQYLQAPGDASDPRAVPMAAADLRGCAPAFIGSAENDPLHDDGALYAQRLRQDGVDVTFDDGPGLIHGYLRARSTCAAARHSYAEMLAWVQAITRG